MSRLSGSARLVSHIYIINIQKYMITHTAPVVIIHLSVYGMIFAIFGILFLNASTSLLFCLSIEANVYEYTFKKKQLQISLRLYHFCKVNILYTYCGALRLW